MSPATTSTPQIPGQGQKQKGVLGSTHVKQQHTAAHSRTLSPTPAAATVSEKGWHLKGWITPPYCCATLGFLYLSLVPSSSC